MSASSSQKILTTHFVRGTSEWVRGNVQKAKVPGLTPRAIPEKFKSMQMIDVHLPTTDGRILILPRYSQPEKELQLLLHQLNLTLPEQPPPRLEELKKK